MAGLSAGAWPVRAQVPTTLVPATTASPPPTAALPTAPATTGATVPRTVARRPSTTRVATTPPPTPPTTVAGTLPPPQPGVAPVEVTIATEDTRPGEGKMPAWPKVLSLVGLAGSAGILGAQWRRTRPR